MQPMPFLEMLVINFPKTKFRLSQYFWAIMKLYEEHLTQFSLE